MPIAKYAPTPLLHSKFISKLHNTPIPINIAVLKPVCKFANSFIQKYIVLCMIRVVQKVNRLIALGIVIYNFVLQTAFREYKNKKIINLIPVSLVSFQNKIILKKGFSTFLLKKKINSRNKILYNLLYLRVCLIFLFVLIIKWFTKSIYFIFGCYLSCFFLTPHMKNFL